MAAAVVVSYGCDRSPSVIGRLDCGHPAAGTGIMSVLALLLLAAASTSVDLVDEVYRILPSEWKYVEVNLRQQPALVRANYRVESGSDKVRLALMTRQNLELLREDLPHGLLAVTEAGKRGEFRFRVREPGDYVVVVDNRGSKQLPASVHLQISLDFARPSAPMVTRSSRARQFTVIGLSFLFFFTVVTYAATRLMSAVKRS